MEIQNNEANENLPKNGNMLTGRDLKSYQNVKNKNKFDSARNEILQYAHKTQSPSDQSGLNNLPIFSNDKDKMLNTDEPYSSVRKTDVFGREIDFIVQNDISYDSLDGEFQRNKPNSYSNPRVCETERCQLSFIPSLCKIDVNTIVCTISCMVSLYCVYTTFSSRFNFQVKV